MKDRQFTVGQIVRETNVSLHKIHYYILANNITPVGRVGAYRMFSAKQVEEMKKHFQIENK